MESDLCQFINDAAEGRKEVVLHLTMFCPRARDCLKVIAKS